MTLSFETRAADTSQSTAAVRAIGVCQRMHTNIRTPSKFNMDAQVFPSRPTLPPPPTHHALHACRSYRDLGLVTLAMTVAPRLLVRYVLFFFICRLRPRLCLLSLKWTVGSSSPMSRDPQLLRRAFYLFSISHECPAYTVMCRCHETFTFWLVLSCHG